MAELIGRARSADAPVIYANDNFGLWRSHHGELVDTALARPHADLIEPIRPDDESLFLVKARHSVFYEAHIRHLEVTVPKDAVASIHPHLASAALEMMERNMGARIITAKEIDFTRPFADTADRRPGTADRNRTRA
jgi:nicotinamidase-related amidase